GLHAAEAVGVVGAAPGVGPDADAAVILVDAGLGGLGLLGLLLAPVLLLLLQAALALQTGLLFAALLVLFLLALPLGGLGPGSLIVLLQQAAADELLEDGEDILGDPVDGQAGGNGEADPQ